MSKPLNFTGTPNDMYQEYLYQDELTEILNEVATSPSKLGKLTVPLTVDRLVDVARTQHRMELRAVSVSTRGDTQPYTEEELLEVFNPSVVLLPQMPYGYYFHKSLEEAGFRVMYHEEVQDVEVPTTHKDDIDPENTNPDGLWFTYNQPKSTTDPTHDPLGIFDFTVEFWIYQTLTNYPTAGMLLTPENTSRERRNFQIAFDDIDNLYVQCEPHLLTHDRVESEKVDLSLGTWTHIAVTRAGSNVVIYKNGVSSATLTLPTNVYVNSDVKDIIRTPDTESQGHLRSYTADFRITKGSVRYTSNFDPDHGPYVPVTTGESLIEMLKTATLPPKPRGVKRLLNWFK